MVPSPQKKIPDMFLRALKRKADVTAPTASVGELEKKVKVDENEVQKENMASSESSSVYTSSASFSLYPVTGIFSLYPLLTDKRWRSILKEEFNMKYMRDVEEFLRAQYAKKVPIFPPREEIFSAFNLTPIDKIRVVIIGQDPYHGVGQAHGLSFSVKKGVPPPPSLKNIYKELSTDIPGFVIPNHGFLEKWALQGVFMLNATLTVDLIRFPHFSRCGKANSHEKIGWQRFTDKVISLVSSLNDGVVFLLWGGFAQKKESLINLKKHAVIKVTHLR
ncbi:hypothetical protein Y032_0035g3070 [Ancylostoma ceylanicum]|uniref:Uracil-DNA glycosylase n=1 Tax=Ancylostoma ceylanicum TaxID=53326 RepID=A0A016UL75_9BILA|nr:hypothetical protein Y032_0035g3070 [Ancylostoma ceylanicum]